MFEEEIIKVLLEEKVIKSREQMVDATVYPAGIKYPTDTGLLEDVRQWLIKSIKKLKGIGGIKEKIRTHCRRARAVYLNFQKKRKRTVREIRRVRKQMLQYVSRNIRQVQELVRGVKDVDILGWIEIEQIKKRLKDAIEVARQQWQMHKNNLQSVEKRIVSFWKPYIRPIVRGKDGKKVEFGPKCSLSYVNGYLFLDKLSFEAYHEGTVLNESLEKHEGRFGKEAEVVIADKIYGSRENRQMFEQKRVQASLIPLGRKSQLSKAKEKWVRQKQRKRNQIEGAIGNSKTTYGLERLRYKISGGEEINIRLGLTAMNLSTMLVRI